MLSVRNIVREFEFVLVASLSTAIGVVSSFFSRLERNLVEEKKRDEIRLLLKLDDFQLRDIGICRDDVKAALMQPMDIKSGLNLSKARKRRRAL